MFTFRRSLFFAAVLSLAAAPQVHAQLSVVLHLTNTTLMRFENIPAVIAIKNNTGISIPAGGATGYALAFDMKGSDGQPLPALSQKTPPALPTLAPGQETTIEIDLFRAYQLNEAAQAVAVARVEYAGQAFLSSKVFLDFQQGILVSRVQLPVQGKTLTYALRRLNRDRHEHLFLRVDDEAAGVTYGTTDLGAYIRQPEPTMMPDAAGNFHILHRSGPQQFAYHIARGDGAILKKELFSGDYQTVRMTSSPQGEITVVGRPSTEKDNLPILKQTPFAPDMHR